MWVVVNYLNNNSEFETFDVKENRFIKKKNTFEKFLRLASLLSYIPTSVGIVQYFLAPRK